MIFGMMLPNLLIKLVLTTINYFHSTNSAVSDLWSRVKELFGQAAQSSAQQPAVHELIQRTEAEHIFKEKFIGKLVHRRLNDWLIDQYAIFSTSDEKGDTTINFVSTKSLRGFVIHFRETQYSRAEIIAFFDYLKDRVLTLNYTSYVSDVKQYNRGQWSEEMQRHYLKPSIRLKEIKNKKINQQFGNINIELLTRNAKVWDLKFSATIYNDHIYNSGEPFGSLLTTICQ